MSDSFNAAELAELTAVLDLPGPVAFDQTDTAMALQAARHRLYHQAYKEMCLKVTGEEPLPIPPDEAEFIDKVFAFLQEKGAAAHEAICIRFRYCERMEKIEWFSIPLVYVVMVAGLLSGFFGWGIAAATWLMATDLLNKLCGCKKAPHAQEERVRVNP